MKTAKCDAALFQMAHQLTKDAQEIEDGLFKGKQGNSQFYFPCLHISK